MGYLRIKELLEEKNTTAKGLASELGIAENSISRIATEKQQPRFELLKRIADYFGVEMWQLFKGSENSVHGYIEYQGKLSHIRSKKDLEDLIKKL